MYDTKYQVHSINRTYNPKFVTNHGDGSGRDGYAVFANGGLNELRSYKGSQGRPVFNNNIGVPNAKIAPRKDATAFDYIPDGTGRDTYIIYNYGLKANFKSDFKGYERSLRSPIATPVMDNRQLARQDSWGVDARNFIHWPSPKARLAERKKSNEQRVSVERLSSPGRVSSKFSSIERLEAIQQHTFSEPVSVRTSQVEIHKLANEIGKESQTFSTRNHQTTLFKDKLNSYHRKLMPTIDPDCSDDDQVKLQHSQKKHLEKL